MLLELLVKIRKWQATLIHTSDVLFTSGACSSPLYYLLYNPAVVLASQ